MLNTGSRAIAALFLAALLASPGAAAGGFAVTTLDGEAGSLGPHLDKTRWNLVMVWTTYCQFCREQYPMVSKFHDDHRARDAVVLGISLDGAQKLGKVRQYRKDQSHSFPSVIADADAFRELYGKLTGETFTGTPTYLLIDKDGGMRAYLDAPATLEAIEQFLAAAEP